MTPDSEDKSFAKRGRLKVFLGALPGVGKTFRMLSEAHRRSGRGQDVVIGIIETHGRPETEKLLEGLEKIPLKQVEYRGKSFYELDAQAVIEHHPTWVLVDELAHTNIPGTEYSVVDQADEVELVDVTPDALINRLKRGDIYHQKKHPALSLISSRKAILWR